MGLLIQEYRDGMDFLATLQHEKRMPMQQKEANAKL